MGAVASFLRRNDDDDVLGVEYDSSQGVVKRIPIEVKPRGKIGLRTGRSVGKPKGSSSLRSALSIELENPEVEKIRKDFEMYRLNKDNEMSNMQKIVRKLETENKMLKAELQTVQKTCQKLREERDAALEAEHQAFVRAMTFEGDRDKIQRQFKVGYRFVFFWLQLKNISSLFSSTRFSGRLKKVSCGICWKHDATLNPSCPGLAWKIHLILPPDWRPLWVSNFIIQLTHSFCGFPSGSGNPGDWWTALESEPSLGSTTQLHTIVSRGPEFAHTVHELEGPYINVNKGKVILLLC